MTIVVVGYGMAGSRVVEQLRARNEHEPVIAFGAEPYAAYNRVLLSRVLAGEASAEDIRLAATTSGATTVRTGVTVTEIDRDAREVVADDGSRTGYDTLVLATGSQPVVPPLAGLVTDGSGELLPGAAVFRTVADCQNIIEAAQDAKRAVVLGGGLLGLEAARGLAGRGLSVEVLHAADHLMDRQLDAAAGRVLARTLAGLGVRVRLGARAQAVRGADRVRGVALADGTVLDADLLVLACGVRPEVSLARRAGLTVETGVVVDDALRSVDDPAVYAVGECAQHDGQVYGLVAPAWEQATVVADQLSGADPQARYRGSRIVTRLKAAGVELAAMGQTQPGEEDPDGAEVLHFCDPARGTYKKLVLRDDRVVGAILLGEISTVATVTQLYDRGTPAPADRLRLLFHSHRNGGGPPESPTGDVTVCHCNGVAAETIEACWRAGAHTVTEIAQQTRATTGCGGCRGQVAGIVARLSSNTTSGGVYQ
ncbi:NAD(P)/FAD-dependent oxidoreductase [Natronosporangium hydrolyticum]|uniref:NAD(P)/FAD-dependent oxidoreductase n=1 Tax=Natronosporangium hydrolyticum TaxID=2811111 RepID=A0A895YPT2_9ACTN|nr:FAD-dependent oxidoreductase [Natronosporangium hydrolyticum]QSB16120.1 NAD(P)/FAD-dependent oxidoreductase [Natronosporangium hydrolyticum]